jgi:hypothetical protein
MVQSRNHRPLALAASCLFASACGGSSPSSPTAGAQPRPPSPPPAVSFGQTAGRTIDGSGGTSIARVTISGDGLAPSSSDADGAFLVYATSDGQAPRSVSFGTLNFVTRQTYMRVPGPATLVSLIPSSFDLTAFDEMFRVSMLLRWTTAPPLSVQIRTVQFGSVNDTTMTAVEDQMSDDEYASVVGDLTRALAELTGGTYSRFESVTRQSAAPDTSVSLLNSGMITI